MIREYAYWVVRPEAWWASGNAFFGPPGATEMRVTTSELASFSVSSPQKAGMLVFFWRSSFNKQAAAFLAHFFLPLFLSLLFGGKGWWKEKKKVKYLGWSCDDAGNTTCGPLTPHIPGSKMRPPSRILGSRSMPSQNPALVRVCLLKINAQKGISPSSGHLPIYHFVQKALVKFGKLNDTG